MKHRTCGGGAVSISLNHMQIELLKRYRAGDAGDDAVTGILRTINGRAAGPPNSG
jgi:phosphoenolpyruvate carboxylase